MLVIKDFYHGYLRNVNLVVEEGLTAVLGPSGSGKTTLLRHMTGIFNLSRSERRRVRGVCYWSDDVTGYRFVTNRLPSEYSRLSLREMLKSRRVADVEAWAERFGVEHKLDCRADDPRLSTGESRCISLCVELSDIEPNAAVMIDEITNGLDGLIIVKILSTLKKIQQAKHLTVITSIHQPSMEALCMFDKIVCMSQGTCLIDGTPARVLNWVDQTLYDSEEDAVTARHSLNTPRHSEHDVLRKRHDDERSQLLAFDETKPVLLDWYNIKAKTGLENFFLQVLTNPREYSQRIKSDSHQNAEPPSLEATVSNHVPSPIPMSLKEALIVHFKIRYRASGLVGAITVGLAIILVINFILYSHLHSSALVPSKAVDELSLDLSGATAAASFDSDSVMGTFAQFEGSVDNPQTREWLNAFSRSLWSTLIYGMTAYNATDGAVLRTTTTNPLLMYVADFDGNQLQALKRSINRALDVVDCLFDSVDIDAIYGNPIGTNYRDYDTSFFDEENSTVLEAIEEIHKTLLVADYFTINQWEMWKAAQECFLDDTSDMSMTQYLCVFDKIKGVLKPVTDCLGWPAVPFTLSAAADGELESVPVRKPALMTIRPRQLAESGVSNTAWADIEDTFPFKGMSFTMLVGRLLTQGVSSDVAQLLYEGKLSKALGMLQEHIRDHCNFSLCQMIPVVWPTALSMVREILKLLWSDLSNIACLFVLTAIVGCSAIESAIYFSDSREIANHFHCRSLHYWCRVMIDTLFYLVPSFMAGFCMTWSLKVPTQRFAKTVCMSGLIAMTGCMSAHALTSTISGLFKNRSLNTLLGIMVLTLFLLISGFILRTQHTNTFLQVVSYASMFRFTYMGLVQTLYDYANGRVGILENNFTMLLVGGFHRQSELKPEYCILVLVAQTVVYRLLGWVLFTKTQRQAYLLNEVD